MSRRALAAGTRTAGAFVILGFATGVVRGSLLGLFAGLVLISFGHGFGEDAPTIARRMFATASVVVAVGVAALRWNTLELGPIRGAQAVLGPTLLVGPDDVALAACVAAAGAALALGAWSSVPSGGRLARVGAVLEVTVIGSIIATGFWGPALGEGSSAGSNIAGIGQWVAASIAAAFVAIAVSVQDRALDRARWVIAVLGAVAVTAGAVLMAGAL